MKRFNIYKGGVGIPVTLRSTRCLGSSALNLCEVGIWIIVKSDL